MYSPAIPLVQRKNGPKWFSSGGGWLGVILDADIRVVANRLGMSSKLPSILSATEEDIQLLLAAQCHIGTKNCDKQMEPYVWKRRQDGERARAYTSGTIF